MKARRPRAIAVMLMVFMIFQSVLVSTQTYTARAAVVTANLSDMLARAEAIVNYTWVPFQDIATWNANSYNGSTVFRKGTTVKGMPYTLFTNEIVSDSLLSLAQYKNVANNNYSTTAYCKSVGATRTGPVYGSCCATFVSEVFGGSFMSSSGNPVYDAVAGIEGTSYAAHITNAKASQIQAGDALSKSGHIIWIGGVTDTQYIIYEQTPPIARKVVVNKSSCINSSGYFVYEGAVYKTISRVNIGNSSHTVDSSYPKDFPATANIKIQPLTDGSHNTQSNRWISAGDDCIIKEVYTDGCCLVDYPSSASSTGRNQLYCKFNDTNFSYSLNCYLDLNGWLDGTYSGGIAGFGTADVYINGNRVADDVSDFYQSYAIGTSYEIKDIKTASGHKYNGVHSGNLSGKLSSAGGTVSVILDFSTETYVFDLNGWLDGKEDYYLSNYGTVDIYINGAIADKGNDINDFYGVYPYGTKFEIKDIKPSAGHKYNGVHNGSISGVITGNTDLRLDFSTETYTITYDANGGSGAPSSQKKVYGAALTLSTTIPTRSGYTFVGWAKSSSATAAAYPPGGTYSENNGAVLYAVWKLDVVRIPGDVNNDGKVTTMDATLIKRYVVGGFNIPVFNMANADVNDDGKVTTMDATLIKRYIVGGYGVVLK